MSAPLPHHSRAQKGRRRDIWRYSVHYSPLNRNLQFGVSRDSRVVHRSRDLTQAVTWVIDQAEAFYKRHLGTQVPAAAAELAKVAAVLKQYGRL